MHITKLSLIVVVLLAMVSANVNGQCSLIKGNGSSQDPNSVCSPITFRMNVWYKFLIPVDSNNVQIRIYWNDGSGSTTTLNGNWNNNSDSVWVDATHVYLPDNQCSKTAVAYLIFDGELCTSSSYQEQTFSTWGTDEENGGVLQTNPVVYQVCEGEDIVNVTFDDNSNFNCNINDEPDNPNRYYRWVQFIYGTSNTAGDRIPNLTVTDESSITHNMTDAAGNTLGTLDGPIIRIPIPADGPNQTSYPISAPAGGIAGDIFEITLRNWNVCNPYDNLPTDGNLPADIINGDNAPIETIALIEIIAPPPISTTSLVEKCTSEPITLTASAAGAEVRWYTDALLSNLVHIGTDFNPVAAPVNLNNHIAGSYTFYVTSYAGTCESAASTVSLIIYQAPLGVFAGTDQLICTDTIHLAAVQPSVGSGLWTTTSGAAIDDDTLNNTYISKLDAGLNQFTWEVTNGPCKSSDNVTIISDRQPDPAFAGPDVSVCVEDSIQLNADAPTHHGVGKWLVVKGGALVQPESQNNAWLSQPDTGTNILVWRVSSKYGGCPVTLDSVRLLVDKPAGPAMAGSDKRYCENTNALLNATPANYYGTGYWTVITGSGNISDTSSAITNFQNLAYGNNKVTWTVQSHYGICPDESDTLTVIRDQSPGNANAGTDKAYCLQNSDTLAATAPITGTAQWNIIENPSGIPPGFNPDIYAPNALITITPGNEGRYKFEWRMVNNTCVSSDTVTIDFGIPTPQAIAGNDTILCALSYPLAANAFLQGEGTWTQIGGPSAASILPDIHQSNASLQIGYGDEGTYTLVWTLKSGTCPPTTDTIVIDLSAPPNTPLITDAQSCGPDSFLLPVQPLGAHDIIQWFADSTTNTSFYTGDVFKTNILSIDTKYYVRSYDTLAQCPGSKNPVRVMIDEIPSKPILIADTLCGRGTATLNGIISSPANLLSWFNMDDTNPISNGLNYISDSLNTNSWFKAIAFDTTTLCQSEPDSVQVVVWPEVPLPITTNDSACGSHSFTLKAIKSSSANFLLWYDTVCCSTPIALSDSLITPTLTKSTSYWVSELNPFTGCESEKSVIRLKIHPVPSAPFASDTIHCGPGRFTISALSDALTTRIFWYSGPVDNVPVHVGDSLQTNLLLSNKSYWLAGINDTTSCVSTREQVDIRISPLPAPLNISGPTTVLKGQSGVIFSTNGLPGSTFTWTIPADINVEQNMNDFIRLGFPNTGNYLISAFETTIGNCPGTPANLQINVIHDTLAVSLGVTPQYTCTKDTFEVNPYLFGGTPPYTYIWSGDTQYLSSDNTLFTRFIPPGTGNYKLYLQVIDVNLRTAFDSVQIVVFESPTTEITTTDSVVCIGSSLIISTQSAGSAPFTHLWSGAVNFLDSYTIANPTFTPRTDGRFSYIYKLTDANQCTAIDTIHFLSDKPATDFEILTQPGCSPLEVEFNNTSKNAVSYEWDFKDGSALSDEINPSHTFSNISSEIKYFNVTLEATSPLGCSGSTSKYVVVWPNPSATLEVIPPASCSPATALFFTTPGNQSYEWDFGTGETETGSRYTTSHIYQLQGTRDTSFNVRVITRSSLNCVDTAHKTIQIYATPNAQFEVGPLEQTFPESSFSITNKTVGTWSYLWEFDNDQSSNSANPGTITYNQPGSYDITLTAYSEHCSDSTVQRVRLYPAPPQAKFTPPTSGCQPHTVTLINNSEYADQYLWDFGDGSISTSKNPEYTYYQSGVYKITLTVKGNGGESTLSDTTHVYAIPNAFFDLAPRYVYVNDEAVNYFNLSDRADAFEWDFGDGTSSTELNPKHIYKTAGTYDVTLKVWTKDNCYDLFIMENAVLVEPSGKIEFPNVFRPNSPLPENRGFKPGVLDNVDTYHLRIYNRWGEMIFETRDPEQVWDGHYMGKIAKQDVYVWKVEGAYTDGQGFSKTGNVTLLY